MLIADAPPHGLETSGDGFPNGDPEGRDPLEILRNMTVHGITCYTVGCWDLEVSELPGMRSSHWALCGLGGCFDESPRRELNILNSGMYVFRFMCIDPCI